MLPLKEFPIWVPEGNTLDELHCRGAFPCTGDPLGQLKLSSQHCQAGDPSASKLLPCQIHLPWLMTLRPMSLALTWGWASQKFLFCLYDTSGAADIPEGSCLPLALFTEPPSLHHQWIREDGCFLPSCSPMHREAMFEPKRYSWLKPSSSPAQSNLPKSSRPVVPTESGSIVPCTTAPAIYHKKLSVKLIQDVSWCTVI